MGFKYTYTCTVMYNTPKGTIGTHSIVSITEQSDATTSPLSRATGGGGVLS